MTAYGNGAGASGADWNGVDYGLQISVRVSSRFGLKVVTKTLLRRHCGRLAVLLPSLNWNLSSVRRMYRVLLSIGEGRRRNVRGSLLPRKSCLSFAWRWVQLPRRRAVPLATEYWHRTESVSVAATPTLSVLGLVVWTNFDASIRLCAPHTHTHTHVEDSAGSRLSRC